MKRLPGAGGVARRALSKLRRGVQRVASRSALHRGRTVWLRVRLGPSLDELTAAGSWFDRDAGLALLPLLRGLDAAAADPRVVGVLVELEPGLGGWSRREAVHRSLVALRRAGKIVVVYADTLDTADLHLGSAASQLWIAPGGSVHVTGVRTESLFLRGLLDRLDVTVDVVRIGSHKAAGETFTREGMSPEQREQLDLLVGDLYESLTRALADGRGLTVERVRALIDVGLFSAAAAQTAGLIDDTCYPDELEERIRALAAAQADEPVALAAHAAWHDRARTRFAVFREPPRVAYVVGRGMIRRGRGPGGITTGPFRKLIRRLRDDERVRCVVLRIDSPGGDGLASDLLWRELTLLARIKPLVVSMGDVAASGGYYLAMAAHAVLAEAGTLTGSIGVVGGKVDLGRFYERFGVRREGVERGERAGFFSETRGFTPGERAALRAEMEVVYDTFVRRVVDGRRLSPDAVRPLAEGRVWSGARAQSIGLVDGLGGPLEAIREARTRAGLADGEAVLLEVHPRLPRLASVRRLLGIAAFVLSEDGR